jgi:hypothetical protein
MDWIAQVRSLAGARFFFLPQYLEQLCGPSSSPIQWLPSWFLEGGGKWPRHKADHLPPSWGTQYSSWLKHYAASRKVTDWNPDESLDFSIDLTLRAALGPWDRLRLEQTGVPRILRGGGELRTTSLPPVSRLENMGASTSHNPMGLHSLLQG